MSNPGKTDGQVTRLSSLNGGKIDDGKDHN